MRRTIEDCTDDTYSVALASATRGEVAVAPTCTKIPVAPGVELEIHNLADGPITDVVLCKNGKRVWLSPNEAIAVQRGLWRAMVETSKSHPSPSSEK